MRVLLDTTPLLGVRTGVGQFVLRLRDALRAGGLVDVGEFEVSWRRGTLPARVLNELWRRSDVLPIGKAADVVHGTNFVVPPSRAARVVTVHDLTVLRFPQMVTPATRAYPDLIRRAVRRGAWVHTPSSFVAAEVVDAFGGDGRVRAIPHGVVPVVGEPGPPPFDFPYVLALGTIEPRKDLPSLVRAFESVAAALPDVRLVVAGPDGWGSDVFNQAVERSRVPVVRLGYVGEPEKSALLAGASVFAYPSLYEGFGLPPLEAMSYGVPVVTTEAGGIPEAVGDGALLVAPGDVDGLAEALVSVLCDSTVRAGLVERGRRRAAALRWEDTAASMVSLYEDARA